MKEDNNIHSGQSTTFRARDHQHRISRYFFNSMGGRYQYSVANLLHTEQKIINIAVLGKTLIMLFYTDFQWRFCFLNEKVEFFFSASCPDVMSSLVFVHSTCSHEWIGFNCHSCGQGKGLSIQGGPKKSLHLHATNFNITQIPLLTYI